MRQSFYMSDGPEHPPAKINGSALVSASFIIDLL